MTDAHAPIAVSGSHWLADLSDCRCKPELLADADLLHVHCVAACLDAGMNVLRSVFQSCPGAGVTDRMWRSTPTAGSVHRTRASSTVP